MYVVGVDSHLSSQIWINLPLPTLQRVPFLTIILLPVKDVLDPKLALRTSPWGFYLALYIQATNEFGFISSLQPCFASMARLNAWRFLKPILPLSLDLYNFLQLTQAILDS